MKKTILAITIFLSAILLSSQAQALVDVEGRYWYTNLDSQIRSSSGSILGSNIDFVDDLGLEDTKGFLEGRITLELGKHKLRYAFVPMKWDGTNSLATSVIFGGQTYTGAVNSDISVNYHRLGYEYDIIDLLSNRVGLIAELKYFDADAHLTATGIDETESVSAPIPTVGVVAQIGLPLLFNVTAELTGIATGSDIYLVDGEAMLNLKPAPFVVLSAGYRYFRIHLEKDNDKADLTLNGPFVSLRANF